MFIGASLSVSNMLKDLSVSVSHDYQADSTLVDPSLADCDVLRNVRMCKTLMSVCDMLKNVCLCIHIS